MSPRRVGAIARHELEVAGRDPMPVMVLVVFPLLLMSFLKPAFKLPLVAAGYAQANGAEQVVPGQAVANGFFVVGMMSLAFFSEHGWNTWERLRASPASSVEIVVGKALPYIAISWTQFAVVFGLGAPLLDLHIRGSWLALVPVVCSLGLTFVMLGVALTALCRTVQQANAIAVGGLVLFGAIGGALVPMNVLPGWARAVAPATPTYWAMRGLRSVILGGGGLAEVALPGGVLVAMAGGAAVIALLRFRLQDRKVSLG